MDSAELHLIQVSQQLAMVAMQAAVAYNQAQSKLDLADVLSGDRLMSDRGIAQSRKTVAELAELTAQHREMFSRYMTGATAQLLAAANQLGESQREEYVQGYAQSVNRNLAAQMKFYAGRERWIMAISRALDLADQHQGDIWIEDGELVFATTALLDQFREHFEEIDAVHEEEVASFHERQAHIADAVVRANVDA